MNAASQTLLPLHTFTQSDEEPTTVPDTKKKTFFLFSFLHEDTHIYHKIILNKSNLSLEQPRMVPQPPKSKGALFYLLHHHTHRREKIK